MDWSGPYPYIIAKLSDKYSSVLPWAIFFIALSLWVTLLIYWPNSDADNLFINAEIPVNLNGSTNITLYTLFKNLFNASEDTYTPLPSFFLLFNIVITFLYIFVLVTNETA